MKPITGFLLLPALFAGCAHDPSAPDSPAESAPQAPDMERDLARLAALDVVTVGGLVVDLPDEATQCYGVCPGFEDDVEAAQAEAEGKLLDLVVLAEAIAAEPPAASAYDPTAVDADLARLDALHIVIVEGFVEAIPENNPYCYNLPCEEDRAAAEAVNAERAALLRAVVARAERDLR